MTDLQKQVAEFDPRRKKLYFRMHHCGIRENDLILGGFAEKRLAGLNDDRLGQLEKLLDENDHDIYLWLNGARTVPDHVMTDVFQDLMAFKDQL